MIWRMAPWVRHLGWNYKNVRNAQWSVNLSVSPVTMSIANTIRAERVSLLRFPQRLQSLGLGC